MGNAARWSCHTLRARLCLGYHFRPDQLSVAQKTMEQFVARAIRLYEQGPGEADACARLGLYVQRWVRWASAGLSERSMKQKVRVDSLPKRYDPRPLLVGRAPQDMPTNYSGMAQVSEDRN